MRSILLTALGGFFLTPIIANAYTVGSYFDVNNQSGYTVDAMGTPVGNNTDPLVAHYEDPDKAFDPKEFIHIITITTANTNQPICEITEDEQIEWAWGNTVNWLTAKSNNNNCQVTYSISGLGDQTSHVSARVG